MLGLFPVNVLHSLFHLTVGILGLLMFRHTATARAFIRGFALILGALTLMGMMPGLSTTLGLAPLFGHDVWLHGTEALAAGYIGFVMPGADPVQSRRYREAESISVKPFCLIRCVLTDRKGTQWSFHNAESQVDSLSSLDHFDSFKRDVLAVQALEQSRAAAEQHGDEMNRDFVNEAEFEELLRNVCARC